MKVLNAIALGIAGISVAACTNNNHLIFGQNHVIGFELAGPSPEQAGGALTLAYKDRNIAIVPVTVRHDNGHYMPVGGINAEKTPNSVSDAYSVLGQFEFSGGNEGKTRVGLGKFFATGIAAQKLAEGFAGHLTKQ